MAKRNEYTNIENGLEKYMESNCKYNDGLINLKGMRNIGNTCYMNAGLQALLSSKILNSRIIRYTQENPDRVADFNPILLEYVQLIYQLIDSGADDENIASDEAKNRMRQIREQTYIVPRNFKDTLSKRNKRFAGYNQQDSQELLNVMLDEFIELPNRMQTPKEEKEHDLAHNEPVFTGIRKLLRDTFFGTYRQVIVCQECENRTDTLFYHNNIILPIPLDTERKNSRYRPENRKTISIADCFGQYSAIEVFDNNNKITCEKCKTKTKSIKKMELEYVPELTIIMLNRFEGLRKINDPIKIYPKIDLDGYPLKLISTVNHSGSVGGGHYTAYVSRSWYDDEGNYVERWFAANDANVSEVDKKSILTDPRIYLAIYERM